MPAFPDETSEISAALDRMPTGSAAAAVVRRLLDLFTSGTLTPGTRLPPERELAARLEVGRSAVREALAALEVLGVVDVRPGSGTYLRGTTSELLPQSLSWGMLIGQRSTSELVEVRGALEIYAARLAASRMDDAAIDRLRARLDEMRASLGDLQTFVEADLGFHREIATSVGNTVLLDLLQIIRSLLRVWVDRAVTDPAQAQAALDEHTAVFDAIASRDAESAANAMAGHMRTAGERIAGAGAT